MPEKCVLLPSGFSLALVLLARTFLMKTYKWNQGIIKSRILLKIQKKQTIATILKQARIFKRYPQTIVWVMAVISKFECVAFILIQ